MGGRGSLQLRHRQRCAAKGKDSRRCRCGPTVYAVLLGEWTKIGYLPEGWRKTNLHPFEEQLADMRRKLTAGEPYKPAEAKLLREWAEEWFEALYTAAEAGDIARSTYNAYEGQWRNHIGPALGDKPLAAIEPDDIRRFIREKVAAGLEPQSANALIVPLSGMMSDARERRLIRSNPCQQPRRARHGSSRRHALLAEVDQTPRQKHLEPVEARALLAATPEPHRTMVLAALSTGFRRGELLGLRWEDIDWGGSRVALQRQLQQRRECPPKCRSYREVVLYSGLREALAKRRQAEGWVFLSPKGRPWGDAEPERAFLREAYEAAGLRRQGRLWHCLRHTHASILAAGGIREDVVAQLMGHARQSMTSHYSHLFADAFDGVEEALDKVLGVNETSPERSVTEEHQEDPLASEGGRLQAV